MTIFIFILIVFALAALLGHESEDSRFKEVESSGLTYAIYRDVETNVLYVSRNRNSFTVMVDENGKPLLYEGDK